MKTKLVQLLIGTALLSPLIGYFISGTHVESEGQQDPQLPTAHINTATPSIPLSTSPQQSPDTYTETDPFRQEFERQHMLLSNLEPSDYVLSETTGNLVRLRKGLKGISNLTYQPEDDWTPITDVISELIPFTGGESLMFERVSSPTGAGHLVYEFSQFIDGVPVSSARLKVKIAPETGKIVGVYSSMISDKSLPRPNIGSDEALEIARYRAREAGLPDDAVFTTPHLQYRRVPREDQTEPVWSFTLGNHTFYVNAEHGEVDIADHVL